MQRKKKKQNPKLQNSFIDKKPAHIPNKIQPSDAGFAHEGEQPKKQSEKRTRLAKNKKTDSGKKKIWKRVGVAFLVLFVIFAGLGIYSIGPARAAYEAAMRVQGRVQDIQAVVAEQDLETAPDLILQSQADFDELHAQMKKLSWVRVIPFASRQYKAADHLVVGGMHLLSAAETGLNSTEVLLEQISEKESASFNDLSSEEKGAMLKELRENGPELDRVLSQLELAQIEFEKIPERGVVSQIAEARDLINDKLPDAIEMLREGTEIAKLLPLLAGYPEEQTYMLLFQNNTELRPSGGFLGSYGELTVKNAEILDLQTFDVYGLDSASDISVDPPWQIQKLAAPFNKSWYMRDSNWSPDFPESAQNVVRFYELEGGAKDFDGVISITPDFVKFLLEITGPTQVPGFPYTFTKDNLTEQLQFHVEKNFVSKGIDFHERKDIISDLSAILLGKIMKLPQEKWLDIYEIVQRALLEKHMVMYFENEDAQSFVEDKQWGGVVQEVSDDYVMVVDANMASLKTDQYIERSFEYVLDATSEKPKAQLNLSYNNAAPGFTWKTTRYRNWNRVYVPEGASFEGVSGNTTGSEYYIDPANPYEVSEELGKSSFGTFVSIEPRTDATLTYDYTLPSSVVDDDEYMLYFQKQIGTKKPQVKAKLKFDKKIQSVYPEEFATIVSDTEVEFNADLQIDREFKVVFK